jgi:molybdopterin-synthase adenylyltransferase
MKDITEETTRRAVERAARQQADAAGRPVRVLDDEAAREIAQRKGISLHEIQSLALSAGICPKRYLRNLESITLQEQLRLSEKTAAVVGAGGLGGNVITLLARIGVGKLIIIDPDSFDETNLNRQALSGIHNVGVPKVQAAAEAVADINPAVNVISHRKAFTLSDTHLLLDGADIIIDCLDNIPDRMILQEAACLMEIPFIHGAIAGFEGQVMTVFPGDKGLERLYGAAPFSTKRVDAPEAVMGTPAPAPALIAALEVMEALKIFLDRGGIHRDSLIHADLEACRIERFTLGGNA